MPRPQTFLRCLPPLLALTAVACVPTQQWAPPPTPSAPVERYRPVLQWTAPDRPALAEGVTVAVIQPQVGLFVHQPGWAAADLPERYRAAVATGVLDALTRRKVGVRGAFSDLDWLAWHDRQAAAIAVLPAVEVALSARAWSTGAEADKNDAYRRIVAWTVRLQIEATVTVEVRETMTRELLAVRRLELPPHVLDQKLRVGGDTTESGVLSYPVVADVGLKQLDAHLPALMAAVETALEVEQLAAWSAQAEGLRARTTWVGRQASVPPRPPEPSAPGPAAPVVPEAERSWLDQLRFRASGSRTTPSGSGWFEVRKP